MKLTKKTDLDKYGYSGYGFGSDGMHIYNFDGQMMNGVKILLFLELIIVFSLYVYIRKKDMLVLDEGPTDGLDDAIITRQTKCSVDITKSRRKFCLSLHYNAMNSFLYANDVKVY